MEGEVTEDDMMRRAIALSLGENGTEVCNIHSKSLEMMFRLVAPPAPEYWLGVFILHFIYIENLLALSPTEVVIQACSCCFGMHAQFIAYRCRYGNFCMRIRCYDSCIPLKANRWRNH